MIRPSLYFHPPHTDAAINPCAADCAYRPIPLDNTESSVLQLAAGGFRLRPALRHDGVEKSDMKGMARVFFSQGTVFLPAKTPYEYELLFEHLDQSAKTHGHIDFEVNQRH